MRLFFALWPDDAAAAKLSRAAQALAASARGQPVPAEKIHLTLVFLGEVDEAGYGRALGAAADLASPSFDLVLDVAGSFRGSKVAWAGCREAPSGLLELQRELSARLERRGFVLEERPFVPHVSLARKVSRPVARAPIEPVGWRAGELALVRTQPGTGAYSTLAAWKLG